MSKSFVDNVDAHDGERQARGSAINKQLLTNTTTRLRNVSFLSLFICYSSLVNARSLSAEVIRALTMQLANADVEDLAKEVYPLLNAVLYYKIVKTIFAAKNLWKNYILSLSSCDSQVHFLN